MIVVSDTSPISGLLLIGELHLLPALFGRVVVPKKVMHELLVLETHFGYDLSELKTAAWLQTETVLDVTAVGRLQTFLDDGESEAIVLARELHAKYLLMDEREGRDAAADFGLKTIGLLGVLVMAKNVGLVLSVRQLMDALRSKARFFIAQKLYEHILTQVGE